MNVLVMVLPGVACLYYGQEIGMLHGPVRPDQVQDGKAFKWSRDPARVPMQWDDSLNAGNWLCETIFFVFVLQTLEGMQIQAVRRL